MIKEPNCHLLHMQRSEKIHKDISIDVRLQLLVTCMRVRVRVCVCLLSYSLLRKLVRREKIHSFRSEMLP